MNVFFQACWDKHIGNNVCVLCFHELCKHIGSKLLLWLLLRMLVQLWDTQESRVRNMLGCLQKSNAHASFLHPWTKELPPSLTADRQHNTLTTIPSTNTVPNSCLPLCLQVADAHENKCSPFMPQSNVLQVTQKSSNSHFMMFTSSRYVWKQRW